MNKTVSVYTITHRETGTVYVGITCNIKNRWKAHRYAAKKNNEWRIHRALNLYGVDAFDWVVIKEGLSEQEAKTLEREMIKKLKEDGIEKYNLTDGGDGMLNPSPETREKLSKAKKGVPKSPQHVENQRLTLIGLKRSAETIEKVRLSRLGSKASEEAKAKMSASRTGKPLTPEWIENIRAGNKGRIKSEQEIANMTAAQRARRAKEKDIKNKLQATSMPPDLKPDE